MNPNGLNGQKKLRILKWIFYAVLVIVFIADFLVERHHATFAWDQIPGFSALFGFVACIVIIIICKAVGRVWLMKKEDYYD